MGDTSWGGESVRSARAKGASLWLQSSQSKNGVGVQPLGLSPACRGSGTGWTRPSSRHRDGNLSSEAHPVPAGVI